MKKFIITGAALVALAVPAVASADAPDGTVAFNPSSDITTMEQAGVAKGVALANGDNLIAWGSSVITQNGQFISGKATGSPDWMHQKGSRSAQVQAELALTGRGSLATP
jgi:hypothetical protein